LTKKNKKAYIFATSKLPKRTSFGSFFKVKNKNLTIKKQFKI
jgi:hypothetical protein